MKRKTAYRFRIELMGIQPSIWRLIEVPSSDSFWDLHVAIQDSMGWLDYHLHSFRIQGAGKKGPILIGIPDDEDEDGTLPGWKIPLSRHFRAPGDEATYEYDFGDGWQHRVVLEGILLQEEGERYPRCLAGERACPPEDCGGVPGYYHLLEVLEDEGHGEHEDIKEWLRGHARNYWPYDPAHFDPGEVEFSDPKERWQLAFQKSR